MKRILLVTLNFLLSFILHAQDQDWRLTKVKEWNNPEQFPAAFIDNKYFYEFTQFETQVSLVSQGIVTPLHQVTHDGLGQRKFTATYKYGLYMVVYDGLILFHDLNDGKEKRRLFLSQSVTYVLDLNLEKEELSYVSVDGLHYAVDLCYNTSSEIEVVDEEEADTFFNKIDTINLGGQFYLEVIDNVCYAYHKTSHEKTTLLTNVNDFTFHKVFINKSGNKLFLKGENLFWIIDKYNKIDTLDCDVSEYYLSNKAEYFFIDDVNFYVLESAFLGAPFYFRVIDLKTCEVKFNEIVANGQYPVIYINNYNSDKYIFIQFYQNMNHNINYTYKCFDIDKNVMGNGNPYEGTIGRPGLMQIGRCGDYYFFSEQVPEPLSGWKLKIYMQKFPQTEIREHVNLSEPSILYANFSECKDNALYIITTIKWEKKYTMWLFEYNYNDTSVVVDPEPGDCISNTINGTNVSENDGNIIEGNVTSGVFHLRYDFRSLAIFSLDGSLVQNIKTVYNQQLVELDLPSGMYIIRGITTDNKLVSSKIIFTRQ